MLLLASCAGERNEVVAPQSAPDSSFATLQPLLREQCGGSSCHGGGAGGFAAGLDLTSHAGIMRGSIYGAVVTPGSAFMSPLLHTINRADTLLSPVSSVAMPAGRTALRREQVDAFAGWIDAGATDAAGNPPFPEPRPLGKVFFTSQAVDLVGVLDLETNLVIRYVTVGNRLPFSAPPQAPHNVQVDDQGRYYYATLIAGNTLKKFDAATHRLLGQTGVGTSPAHVVVTPDGAKAYVTNFDQSVGRVYVVETAGMTVRKVITAPPLMRATHGARLSQDGRYLYVGSNGTDLLHVIDTAADSVVAHVPVAPGVPPIGSFVHKPYQVAVRSDDRFIYTTLNGSGLVSVIRRDGDAFRLDTAVRVGASPLQCEASRDGRWLYVCNRGSGSVSVIDAQTNLPFTTIADVGRQPHGVDITDDSRLAYVTCENISAGEPPHHPVAGSRAPAFVAVISLGTHQVVRRIEVGGFAAGVSITPGRGN